MGERGAVEGRLVAGALQGRDEVGQEAGVGVAGGAVDDAGRHLRRPAHGRQLLPPQLPHAGAPAPVGRGEATPVEELVGSGYRSGAESEGGGQLPDGGQEVAGGDAALSDRALDGLGELGGALPAEIVL